MTFSGTDPRQRTANAPMNRLRNRLILVFVVATIVPLGLTLWFTRQPAGSSASAWRRWLSWTQFQNRSNEPGASYTTNRANCCGATPRRGASNRKNYRRPKRRRSGTAARPTSVSSRATRAIGSIISCATIRKSWRYSRPMAIPMGDVQREIGQARQALDKSAVRDLRRGFSGPLLLVTSALWLAALGGLVYLAARISRPVQQLTEGLGQVAAGDLGVRVEAGGSDEIGAAVDAFNHMAGQLEQARERLIHVTRLASWQALARKMAHEVKNSLTPIRLTMEEIIRAGRRRRRPDRAFLEQAAQIVADEVNTLEKRVRAFSEFASEPPVMPCELDVNALVEERVALLRSAHPDIAYSLRLASDCPPAVADPDLVKGMLTNLLENAAQAAQPGGEVLAVDLAQWIVRAHRDSRFRSRA